MSEQLKAQSLELQDSKIQLIRQQEEMRRSFLRGVSALNVEAMEWFKEDHQRLAIKAPTISLEDPPPPQRKLVTRHFK